ncbi:MAG: pyrroline-5-carboxylate reductase [Verrucomicrobiota bacterium]
MHLGLIGCGKMGQALIKGVLHAQLCAHEEITIHDRFAEPVNHLVSTLGLHAAGSNQAVADQADTVILAVKPSDIVSLLTQLTHTNTPTLFISIAAGIRISTLEQALEIPQSHHRIIRVMPNTPALIRKAASAYTIGSTATESDAASAERILGAVGLIERVPENLLDAVTALSGSGPAYIFAMIESMIAGAIDLGLNPSTARHLTLQTVIGAAEMVAETGESPAQLRENVTSPNGTTFAALQSMQANHFDETIRSAIEAAHSRSLELGKQSADEFPLQTD